MFDFIVPIIGLIAGILAVLTLPDDRRDPGGALFPVLLGFIGAYLGGYGGRSFAPGAVQNLGREVGQPGFYTGIIGAVVGSAVLLIAYRLITRKTTAD
jgi:uncharacterized membrane protein YeaQ/YmgE (transglycosylase-associated protein family)